MAAHLESPITCIAHRGGPRTGILQENSLEAIKASLAIGVDAIEIDVWQVHGQVLVTHDRRLGRLLPGSGRLLEHSPVELKHKAQEAGFHMPTLEEVLDLVQDRALLNIELKGPHSAEAVSHLLAKTAKERHWGLDHYLVSSFDHQQLLTMKQHLPRVKRGVLIEGIPLDYAACCTPLEAFCLIPNINFISQSLIDDAHMRGCECWVYTVNEIDDMLHLGAMGVDGIFTDFPERLLALNTETRTLTA
ncbi:glycerophosphodiester phosphodiesterase [Marinibactrum halimedae]|uniref:Glycerophosphoryl diester phosphodiesterase n=1 Tax=Marinibactrum halimedae TaxID=1444977 RepID=A0AA37TCS0_9GAMM|nr:glycerophosphodiester phosphodiesterase [Marinibactrum halimedae]MCD9458949.1 glycerophosphodiester phosphodiesterase [Marinibactrum halimedae]GLS26922.1 glycerophosphoryl diester phosphodiesterase [Marinibactrum halimedae]